MDEYRADARSDRDLVAAVIARQPEALQELYTRYSSAAYALAVRMLADRVRAEECMHTAFLAFWQEPHGYDPASGGFCAWLLAVVHRTARTSQRAATARARRAPAASPARHDMDLPPLLPEISARLIAIRRLAGQHRQAQVAVDTLSPAERIVLESAYFNGWTTAEIAALRKEPLPIVEMRIREGVQRLSAVFARSTQPQTLDAAPLRPGDSGGPSHSRKARALADQSNPEYRATVRHVLVGQERGEGESSLGVPSAKRLLDERQDQLLLTLGHELKTPITTIKGTVQLAHHRLRAAGHLQEAALLAVANGQIDRLTALVDYLLRAGQLDGSEMALQIVRFDFAHLVREVAQTMQGLTGIHTLSVEAPDDVEIEGDVVRLEQVVSNLINNAIKYSPAGGAIEITLRHTGNEALLCMRDYGIGIPPEDRDLVFERFERATNVGHIPGFGLGLSMCRDIINAHHGRIWVGSLSEAARSAAITVESPPAGEGPGSLICVALPLDQAIRP